MVMVAVADSGEIRLFGPSHARSSLETRHFRLIIVMDRATGMVGQ